MKLTDFVAKFLADRNVNIVFGVTGGGIVHLFDSLDKNEQIETVFTHHEQAAALAAVSYARIKGFGATVVTTGPAGTNTITGVLSAWQDSIPCIFISGQSRFEHISNGKNLRQLGTQEFDIVNLVKPITKYSVVVESPNDIKYHLEKAFYMAKEGRPGPVWIDIPLNYQWENIDLNVLRSFQAPTAKKSTHELKEKCEYIYNLIKNSERPIFVLGYGVRLANAQDEFAELLRVLDIPFVGTWTASDMIPTDHELNIGRPGIAGQRGANLVIQNSDLLIALGSHLSIPITGTSFDSFAREAKVVLVNIDHRELEYDTVKLDYTLECNVKDFLVEMINFLKDKHVKNSSLNSWQSKCKDYKRLNEIPKAFFAEKEFVNPYVFMEKLSNKLYGESIVVDGGGTNLYISFQGLKTKKGQRLLVSSAIASMGTGLPESIGACLADNRQTVICLSGDGSMQFNIQELQTVLNYNLPVKIFVMNNQGYLAIRHTQKAFLESNFAGSSDNGGVKLPDFKKVAQAYGIETVLIKNNSEIDRGIESMMSNSKPMLCELIVNPEQDLICTQTFKANPDGTFSPRPLEDMAPLLDRDEFNKLMITKPLKVSE